MYTPPCATGSTAKHHPGSLVRKLDQESIVAVKILGIFHMSYRKKPPAPHDGSLD
jgi:hypothetical protein